MTEPCRSQKIPWGGGGAEPTLGGGGKAYLGGD